MLQKERQDKFIQKYGCLLIPNLIPIQDDDNFVIFVKRGCPACKNTIRILNSDRNKCPTTKAPIKTFVIYDYEELLSIYEEQFEDGSERLEKDICALGEEENGKKINSLEGTVPVVFFGKKYLRAGSAAVDKIINGSR
jgi:glutaredoxin